MFYAVVRPRLSLSVVWHHRYLRLNENTRSHELCAREGMKFPMPFSRPANKIPRQSCMNEWMEAPKVECYKIQEPSASERRGGAFLRGGKKRWRDRSSGLRMTIAALVRMMDLLGCPILSKVWSEMCSDSSELKSLFLSDPRRNKWVEKSYCLLK